MHRFFVRRVHFPLSKSPRWPCSSPGPVALVLVSLLVWVGIVVPQPARADEPSPAKEAVAGLEWQISERSDGRRGGELAVDLTSEPQTFLPLRAYDTATRAVLERMHAGLVRLDLATLEIQPALASSWDVSQDRRRVTLELRRGVRFSDGEPFDADDVIFSLRAVQDPTIIAAQASALVIDGKPVEAEKTGPYTVRLALPAPHPAPLLLLTGIPMLPEHRLGATYERGDLPETWTLGTAPEQMAGLGPFRLAAHRPGRDLTLERNPHYWRRDAASPEGTALPYLDRVVFRFVADETAKVLRFRGGESDLLERIPGDVFAELESRSRGGAGFEVRDLGPGLGYTFLIFNLNEVEDQPDVERAQAWFRRSAFRRAVSLAVDRPAIARLVYHGRAAPVVSNISPANERFYDPSLEDAGLGFRGPRLEAAGAELQSAGFRRGEDGRWRDAEGEPVAFTLLTNPSNAKRSATATLVQEDLRRLGLDVTFVGLDFNALVERLTESFDYDLILLEFGGGDMDPNSSLNVWRHGGDSHFFHLASGDEAFGWDAEIDRLMRRQSREIRRGERRELVMQAQGLLAREVPFVFLVAPNVLVGADRRLGNFAPSVLDPPTLWNADELYWKSPGRP